LLYLQWRLRLRRMRETMKEAIWGDIRHPLLKLILVI
jgi:hypothetical protein